MIENTRKGKEKEEGKKDGEREVGESLITSFTDDIAYAGHNDSILYIPSHLPRPKYVWPENFSLEIWSEAV